MLGYAKIFLWIASFCALFFAIFWVLILKLEARSLLETKNPKKFPFISLIIPTRNGAATIAKTLTSVLKADYPKNKLEVIVALNGCTDNTAEVVKPFLSKQVRMINVPVPQGKRGKAFAFNEALNIAKGELVGCLDDDSIITPSSIKKLVHHFEDKKVAAAIPTCKVYKPKKLIEKVQVMEYALSSFSRKLLTVVGALFVTPGVLSLYNKDILRKAGGFDVNSLTEDFEIAVRLNKLGYKIEAQLNSITYTHVPNTFLKFHQQRVRWFRGFLTTTFKHKDMLFNPKHGILGMFIFPVIITLFFVALFATIVISYDIVHRLHMLILTFTTFNLEVLKTLKLPSVLAINPLFIEVIIVAAFGVYLLNVGYKYTQNRWHYPLATLLFFTLYQTLLAAYWLIAIVYEISGIKCKW